MGLPNLSVSIFELLAIRNQFFQGIRRFLGGVGPVADLVFYVQRELSDGLFVRGQVEHWVIAETVVSLGCVLYHSGHETIGLGYEGGRVRPV